jgi:hypothetical protein
MYTVYVLFIVYVTLPPGISPIAVGINNNNNNNKQAELYDNTKLRGLSLQVNYTEGPPLVSEVGANFCGWRVPRGQRDGSLRPHSRLYIKSLKLKGGTKQNFKRKDV